MSGRSKNILFLIFLVLLGGVAGTLVGDILGSKFDSLNFLSDYSYNLGLTTPLVFDVKVLKITFGFSIYCNLMTVLGMILGAVVYRNY
ncbi:DUF4321 domain-containing protein [Oceanirhabdus sp. W0125-5]|uniref:DUF4321 domain-containing protein n=1 Tax=Oceanirhabdus sp. W0125-5 TaxID=2999116 RepID=UPI0022F2E6D7|nr:DUF4321 domain-containing protein [Oceanirhabdus sp. W0125-5]WBW95870.1 DUF4321 domain-containing protein [Oceanirhabdus sp. W0125-5]